MIFDDPICFCELRTAQFAMKSHSRSLAHPIEPGKFCPAAGRATKVAIGSGRYWSHGIGGHARFVNGDGGGRRRRGEGRGARRGRGEVLRAPIPLCRAQLITVMSPSEVSDEGRASKRRNRVKKSIKSSITDRRSQIKIHKINTTIETATVHQAKPNAERSF